MSEFELDAFDVDGAIREAADDVDHQTRAAFLGKAAVGGGAVLTSGAIMSMLPAVAAAAPSRRQDLSILNFALTLEYLEAAFYKEAVDSGALSGPVLELARLLNNDEQTHVTALRQTIRRFGARPISKPNFNFMDTNKEQGRFLETSFTLENTGVRAYVGQAPRIQSRQLLASAASIATVEGRHAAAVAVLIGRGPFGGERSITPSGAFDRASSMSTIRRQVARTKFIQPR